MVDIDFSTGEVSVNGEILSEPYTSTGTTVQHDVAFPLTVDEGCVFVLGDNRSVSKDSRSPEIGFVDKREILGKAILNFLPQKIDGKGFDFGRFGGIS